MEQPAKSPWDASEAVASAVGAWSAEQGGLPLEASHTWVRTV